VVGRQRQAPVSLSPGKSQYPVYKTVVTNLGYAYLQGREEGHLGVREKNRIMAEKDTLTLRLIMYIYIYIYIYIYSKARNLTSYIYGRNILLGVLLLEPCISLIYA
jgi:hypothetical protein